MLEEVNDGRGHGILTREQEGEDDHGDLVIRVFSGQDPSLFLLSRPLTSRDHLPDPSVEETSRFVTLGHESFRGSRGRRQMLHGDLSRLTRIVHVGPGESEGEVDQLERDGDQPVLVRDLGGRGVVHVVPGEYSQGSLHVEIPHGHHVGFGCGRRVVHP